MAGKARRAARWETRRTRRGSREVPPGNRPLRLPRQTDWHFAGAYPTRREFYRRGKARVKISSASVLRSGGLTPPFGEVNSPLQIQTETLPQRSCRRNEAVCRLHFVSW